MEIASLHPPLSREIKASHLPLERLATNPHLTEAEKIGELSRQFEAVLLRQILREAHKAVIKSNLMDESVASDIYQDMITNQMAESISQSGSFGLAQSLRAELTRQWGAGMTTEDASLED